MKYIVISSYLFTIFLLTSCSGTRQIREQNDILLHEIQTIRKQKLDITESLNKANKQNAYLNNRINKLEQNRFLIDPLICNEDFLKQNFEGECLLQILSFSNLKAEEDCSNITDCLILVLLSKNSKKYFLYSPQGELVLDKYKDKYSESFYKCSFSNTIINPKGNNTAEPKYYGINLSRLTTNTVYYCGDNKLSYRIFDKLPTGEYIQLSTVKYLRCERFLKCSLIGSIMIERSSESDFFKIFVSGTNSLKKIKKCRDFKDAFIVKRK